MDLQALQAILRDAAGTRRKRPVHTPKNLAMALMVEAAGLLETFQWLTPEESLRVADDVARRQHIGDDLADVLLVLVQLADLTQVDLNAAVQGRLAGRVRKPAAVRHPTDAGLATVTAGTQPGTHVLLDYENVQPTDAELRQLVPEVSRLWVFHGPHQKQTTERFASFGDDLSTVPIRYTGKNSLDFHLSFYIGYIAARNPGAQFVVLANDKGYEPMLEHARGLGFDVRSIGIQRVARPRPARRAEAAPEGAAVVRKPAPRRAASAAAAQAAAAPPGQTGATGRRPATKPVRKPAAKAGVRHAAPTATDVVAKAAPRAPRKPATAAAPSRKAVASPRAAARQTTAAADQPPPAAANRAKAKRAAATTGAAQKAAPRAAPAKPAATPGVAARPGLGTKIEQRLRQLGVKRPTRLARLRGVVKSLLGATASADEVSAAVGRLTASGAVVVDSAGDVSYPAWT